MVPLLLPITFHFFLIFCSLFASVYSESKNYRLTLIKTSFRYIYSAKRCDRCMLISSLDRVNFLVYFLRKSDWKILLSNFGRVLSETFVFSIETILSTSRLSRLTTYLSSFEFLWCDTIRRRERSTIFQSDLMKKNFRKMRLFESNAHIR